MSQSMDETRWSIIHRIGDPRSVIRRNALAELFEIYRSPMIHFLMAKGCDESDAEDFVHDFIQSKMLSDKFFEQLDPTQGRFRSYLRASLRNFQIDQWRKESRRREVSGMDHLEDRAGDSSSTSIFDKEWALQVLRVAYELLIASCTERKRPDYVVIFNARVWHPHFDGDELVSYAELKKQGAIKSVRDAQNSLVTAKRMYKRCLVSTVKDTLSDHDLLEEELQFLYRILEEHF